jgi:hypothetical protein
LKTSALGTFAATALLALTIPACAGPAATPVNGASPTESATATAIPTVTPTPVSKEFTSAGLAAIVRQVRDSADRRLTVLPDADVAAVLEQSKGMLSSLEVEPALCLELATSSTVPAMDGAAMAVGVSTDTSTGAVTALSLLSGLDEAALGNVTGRAAQLQQCANMTVTVEGVSLPVAITILDSVGEVGNTVAYRTETQMPDGQVQSIITAQAIQQGVVLTAVASGAESEADTVLRAGALLDSAAALIK